MNEQRAFMKMSTLHNRGVCFIFVAWSVFAHMLTHQASGRPSTGQGGSAMNRLMRNMLWNYNNVVEPSMGLTTVSIHLDILNIDYNSDTEELDTRAWQKLKWTDTRLAWDKEEYPDIEAIHLPVDRIWKPDIMLYNSIKKTDVDEVLAVISFNGSVSHIAPVTYHTLCRHLGEPIITCDLTLGSWTYDRSRIGLNRQDIELSSLHNFSGRFEAINATDSIHTLLYECCPVEYMDYTFSLTFRVEPEKPTHRF